MQQETMRTLGNSFTFVGKITKVDRYQEGTTKDKGNPYVSSRFTIQVGDDPNISYNLEMFQQATTSAGKSNRSYDSGKNVLGPIFKAITNNTPVPETYVRVQGQTTLNPYVDMQGELSPAKRLEARNIDIVTNPTQGGGIMIEGYINKVVIGEEGGFTRVDIIGSDWRGHALTYNGIIVDPDIVEAFLNPEYQFVVGATSTFTFERMVLNKQEPVVTATGGIGKRSEVVSGNNYAMWTLVQADIPYTEETNKKISREQITALLTETDLFQNEILAKGYQGKQTTQASAPRGIGGTPKPVAQASPIASGDIPF